MTAETKSDVFSSDGEADPHNVSTDNVKESVTLVRTESTASNSSLRRRMSSRESMEHYDFCWKTIRDKEKEKDEEFWFVSQLDAIMHSY